MSYRGTVKGNTIEMDEPLPFPQGSRVEVALRPAPRVRRGSPRAVLGLAGTLSHDEAELIRKGAAEIRRVDAGLWREHGQ
ncbi:MAG: hypothetical protein FJ290_04725 [Planctomycetes bacterium]|nr:hypothetical protein [Planctomycetota bacterium]